MVEIADIVDQESLRDWLVGQTQEVSVWIAHRSAMRVLPVWCGFVLNPTTSKKFNLTALPVLRCDLMSGVSRIMPTANIMQTASDVDAATTAYNHSAANAAYATVTANAVIDATAYAARAANATWSTTGSTDAAAIWKSVRADCTAITSGDDLDRLPLWGDQESPLAKTWADVKQQLPTAHSDETARGADTIDWSFWIKWYDDALAGNPPNWDMLERIALIDPEEWGKGAERVNNELIPEILKDYPTTGGSLAGETSAKTKRIETIRQSIVRNRAVVPAQLQGLIAIITAEMERLRSINVMDDIEAKNRDRQLGIFQSLADGIEALESAVPLDREPMIEDAEKIDGLLTVYANEFRKWPRDNATDMVDSTVRVALVGMTAGLAVTFGVPMLAGVAVGGIAFGGKKLAGAAKSLKDSVNGGT